MHKAAPKPLPWPSPDTDPGWDPNQEGDLQKVRRDPKALIGGPKEGEGEP